MNAHAEVTALPDKPYPGLRAFEASEWAIYFGRENAAKDVIKLLVKRGLVLIHGASGCGKSSLVRAGVLPSLEIDHEIAKRRWRTAVMRPSEGPLESLAEILEEHLAGLAPQTVLEAAGEEGDEEPIALTTWHDHVFDGRSLISAVEHALAKVNTSLCIVVDQFEEIFRWSRDLGAREQANVFVEFLRASGARAGRKQRLFVILTMRSDYLGHCARFDGFAEFLNERQYLLPKIDDYGLLCAIHEPAALYGGSVEDAVANRLLPMVAKEQDGLPVLQHALMRAWAIARRRTGGKEGWRITVDDLDEVGGAQDALADHAEEILAKRIAENPTAEEAAAWMFRALTDLDADRRAIRRPCQLGELIEIAGVEPQVARDVIDAFRADDCCFLSPYGSGRLSDDTEIDISHEALIRRWPRINDHAVEDGLPKGWLDREFQDGLVWRLLAVQAQAFRTDRRNILSPASAKTRAEWYETIKPRKAWIKRHAITPDPDDKASLAKEWNSVAALMAASEKNREEEESIVARLRRWAWFLAAAAISAVAIAVYLYVIVGDLNRQKTRAAQMQDTLIQQLCTSQEKERAAEAGRSTDPADLTAPVEKCVAEMKQNEGGS